MLSNSNNNKLKQTQIVSFVIHQKSIQRLYMTVSVPGRGGQEMEVVEEYSLSKPYLLLSRKRLVKKKIIMSLVGSSMGSGSGSNGSDGGSNDWIVEVGDEHVIHDTTTTQHGT